MPFSPNAQYARNVSECLMCSECLRPRVIYAKHKLRFQDSTDLKIILGDVFYTCGSTIQEMISDPESSESLLLSKVFVRANLSCQDHVEKLSTHQNLL